MKTAAQLLKEDRDRIDCYLGSILPKRRDNLKSLAESLRYAVFSGGKRVRPVLLLQAYRLCGGKDQRALPAAAAVELIHAFSLVQDDLPAMDNDDLRRGKPTLHRAFPEYTALLASDYLLILAFRELAGHYPPEVALAAAGAIGLEGLTAGQFLDLAHLKSNPDEKTLEEIRRKKTAALFELAFRLGAMIAGGKADRVRLMAGYGRDFGLAFQIRDDLADAEKLETPEAMKRKVALLTGRMAGIERKLKISSPVLDYFRGFLRDASR